MVAVDPQLAARASAPAAVRRRRLLAATAASAVTLTAAPLLGAPAHAAPAAQSGYQVVSAATTAQGQPLASTFSADAYLGPAASIPSRQAYGDGPFGVAAPPGAGQPPPAPPYGFGSRQATFDVVDGSGADVSGQQTEVFRTIALNNVRLDAFTTPAAGTAGLRFSTFASNLDGGGRVPRPFTLRLSVDADGNNIADTQLTYVFDPNQPLQVNAWQTWRIDPAASSFQINNTTTTTTLSAFVAMTGNANAKILENNTAGSQPSRDTGTGFVGGGGGGATARSLLAVDGFGAQFGAGNAGNVLYDFEGTRTTPPLNPAVVSNTYIDPNYAPNPTSQPTAWGRRSIDATGTATNPSADFRPGPPSTGNPPSVPAGPAGPPFRSAGNPLPGSVAVVATDDPIATQPTQEYRGNPFLFFAIAGGRPTAPLLPLRDLAQLRYATYVSKNPGSVVATPLQQPANFTVVVSLDGAGGNLQKLTFVPSTNASGAGAALNPNPAEDTWQTWEVVGSKVNMNAFNGSLSSGANDLRPVPPNAPLPTTPGTLVTWTSLLAQYPDAVTIPTVGSGAGALDPNNGTAAFTVGGGMANGGTQAGEAQRNSTVSIDGLRASFRGGAGYNVLNSAFVSFTNDFEPLPVLLARGSTVTENGNQPGNNPSAFVIVPVRALNKGLSVDVATQDGTARAGVDYTAIPTTPVNVPAGAGGANVGLTIAGDDIAQNDRTVLLTVTNPQPDGRVAAIIQPATTIIRDDDAPAVTVGDATAPAGSTLQFPITLNRAAAGPITLTYASVDGTATAPEDYTAVSGKVTIPTGATRVTVPVPTRTSVLPKGPRTIELRFFDLQGGPATLPRTAGTGTITDPVAGSGGTGGTGGGGGVTTVPDLTLKASKTFATLGSRVTYSGGLTRGNIVLAGVPVLVTVKYVDGQVKPIGLATTGPNGSFSVTTKPLYNGTVTATALGATASTPSRVIVVFPQVSASSSGGRVTVKASVAPGFNTGPNRNLRVQLRLVDGSGKVLKVLDTRNAASRHGLAGYAQGVNDITFSTPQLSGTARYAVKVIGTPVNTGATSRSVTVPGRGAAATSRMVAI